MPTLNWAGKPVTEMCTTVKLTAGSKTGNAFFGKLDFIFLVWGKQNEEIVMNKRQRITQIVDWNLEELRYLQFVLVTHRITTLTGFLSHLLLIEDPLITDMHVQCAPSQCSKHKEEVVHYIGITFRRHLYT